MTSLCSAAARPIGHSPRQGRAAGLRIDTSEGYLRGHFEAMASPCEILIDAPDQGALRRLIRQAAAETWRIERKFSRYRPDSVVSRINAGPGRRSRLDAETARLLDFAAQAWRLSDGRFDITSGVLRAAWHFDGSDRIPSAEQVGALLPRVGWHKLQWQSPWLTLPVGMELDLGGIGKEYAVDRVLERLVRRCGAPVLVNFGGDLRCSGPRANGQPWRIGIDAGGNSVSRTVELSAGALATSGDANRYLLANGRRYGHVLDPRTGWPVPDCPASVTVAASTATTAGMLATLALLHGADAEQLLVTSADLYWVSRVDGGTLSRPGFARAESCKG